MNALKGLSSPFSYHASQDRSDIGGLLLSNRRNNILLLQLTTYYPTTLYETAGESKL